MHGALTYLFPGAKPGDWLLQDDGEGPFIAAWNRAEPQPTASQIAAAQLPANKAALVAKIRTDANKVIGDAIGNFGNEYTKAKVDSDAFKAAAYLGAVPSSVSSWATAKGWTAMQACDDILLTASNFLGAEVALRANRLQRTEAAKACTTQAQLDTVAAQWAGFVSAIRSSLGV